MKGIIGAERASTYTQSSYESGDQGGSAGGYGLHGMKGQRKMGAEEFEKSQMPSLAYGGVPIAFEGGHRGGAVSEPETLPSQAVFAKKTGYDEHRTHGAASEGTIHGLPGVEGIKPPTTPPGDHGMRSSNYSSPDSDDEESEGNDGYGCPHGCGAKMRSSHGLARHVSAKHGGFRGLGHSLVGKHGSSYAPSHRDTGPAGESSGGEMRGETEGPRGMKAIAREWESAKEKAKNSSEDVSSTYGGGDGGGSYGKMKNLTSGR